MSIYSKLSSLLTAANTKTGESDATLTDAMQTLIDGYGSGGGGGTDWDGIASGSLPSGKVVLSVQGIEQYVLAYRSCPSWSVYAPNVTYMGQNAFRESTTLTEAKFPSLNSGHNTGYSLYGCTALTLVDWGSWDLRQNTFVKCSSLKTLILRKSTAIQTCANTSVFDRTPFANSGSGGTIYIPKALYDHLGDGTSLDYKAASNWSVYDGYGTITWAKLEGSPYETYSADGTPIS